MAERVISERVISRKIVKSKNPLVRKFERFGAAAKGIFMGPVFFLLAIGLLIYSEGFSRSSEIISTLSLETASEVTADSGTHKLQGTAVLVNGPVNADEVGDVLYFNSKVEMYEQVKETKRETVTTVENGVEVEEVIEREVLVDKWVERSSRELWADFKLGKYTVKAASAKDKLNLEKGEYYQDFFGDYEKVAAGSTRSPELGDVRLTVNYLPLDDELIVIGDISGETISTGEVFIVSNMTDAELLTNLESAEKTQFFVLKAVAWFLLTLGFGAIFGPVLALLDFIPIAGKVANGAAGFIGAILALILVVVVSLLVKFWWLVLILCGVGFVGLIVLLVVLVGKKKDNREEKE